MSDNLCEVCHVNSFKYKCPGCLKKTCSLECSKRHKAIDSCDGKSYNPTNYVSSGTLKDADDEKHENNYLVQRDYNFLTNIKRQLEIEKLDGKKRNRHTLQNTLNNNSRHVNAGIKRARLEEECHRVIRRGVNCLLLPRGMQRSTLNKSKWDKKLDLFVWTVEWILCPHKVAENGIAELQELSVHTSHRFKETANLIAGMSNAVYEKCCQTYNILKEEDSDSTITRVVVENGPRNDEERTQRLLKSGLKFYTKQFPYDTTRVQDSKDLVELDPIKKCLGEIFRNRTVIEFPTIYVAQNANDLPKGFKIVPDEAPLHIKREVPFSSDGRGQALNMQNSKKLVAEDSTEEDNGAPNEEPFLRVEPPSAVNSVSSGLLHKIEATGDEEEEEEDGYDPTIL